MPKAAVSIRKPRAALLDNIELHADIQQLALAGNAFTIHDIEFRLFKRRRHFIFHDLRPRTGADELVPRRLELLNAAHVDAHGSIKFQRAAAGGYLRVAIHHTDLFTQLIDKDQNAVGF